MIERDEHDDPADKPAADEGLTIDEGDDALEDDEDDDEDYLDLDDVDDDDDEDDE
jgi:hypothetical protein